MIIFIIILIAVIAVIWGIGYNNKIVQYTNEVSEKEAQIDVQLAQRTSEIPKLVSTIKGYTQHEHDTLMDTMAARNGNVDRKQKDLQALAQAADDVEHASKRAQAAKTLETRNRQNNLIPMDRLLMLTENYPDLKANTGFLQLQNEITHLETMIADSRRLYNNTVKDYNNVIGVFPGSLIANMKHATPKKQLEFPDEQTKDVEINF